MSIKTSFRNCPICDNADAEMLHTQKFSLPTGHPLPDSYDVVCCVRCGFVYADTAATQTDYDRFYTQFSKYEDPNTSTGSGENFWEAKRMRQTAGQITSFLQDSSARILDIGCANGGLLKALKELGFQKLYGIDPSPACVENVRRLGIEAYRCSLFQPLKLGPFNCVILSHVLEHVQNLKQVVRSINQSLDDDRKGRVYIEVPDASRYTDYLFAPFQGFNTEHINHFSIIYLENLMGPAGFALQKQAEKIIESSPNMPYPAIYSFWAKKGQSRPPFVPKRDDQLAKKIKEYILKSQSIMNGIEAKLQKALAQSPEVIVWGTGQLAMKLLAETLLAKAQIAAFVDSNPINQGKMLRGVRILSPEQARHLSHPIIVTTILHQKDIVEQIRHMGLRNNLILLG